MLPHVDDLGVILVMIVCRSDMPVSSSQASVHASVSLRSYAPGAREEMRGEAQVVC